MHLAYTQQHRPLAAVADAAGGRDRGGRHLRRQTRCDAACVGRHLATRNEMRVSGSRQLRIAVLV